MHVNDRQDYGSSDCNPAVGPVDIDLGHELGHELEGNEGRVLRPGQPGYREACRVWNAMIDRQPAVVVQCRSAVEVQQCIRSARQHGLGVTVRGGGHHIGGRAIATGALLVDFGQQRAVVVDPDHGHAEVQPGALLKDVDHATGEHGLVLPTGIVSETGVAGLALGGGFGWLSRRFGLTSDHLVEAEVVTGTGEVVLANQHENPDLLWLLRGGGGGGGIVTRFRFRLQHMAPTVVAGLLIRESERTQEVAHHFRTCAAEAPEEMTYMLKLCAAPPAPFLPPSVHGKPVGIVVVCHSGTELENTRDLAHLRSGGPALADLIKARPFTELQAMFDVGEPKGRRDYWKSEYVDELDDATLGVLLDAINFLPSPWANMKIFQLGGQVARVRPSETAAGHRDARFIIVIASAWADASRDEANIGWVRDTWARIHRPGRGGYINFLTADADAEQRAGALAGVDLERLAAIRKRYDPDGIFVNGR